MNIDEDLILRSAVSQGLITLEELERFVSSRAEESPLAINVNSLIESGRLDADSIASLRRKFVEDQQSNLPVESWTRYELIGSIGQGGMGRVYKAFDPRLKRYVALKFIRHDDPTMVKRFMREAQAQAKIEHDHVCRIHEVDEVNGKPYIAMQLIDGATLNVVHRQMSTDQKVEIIQKISEAVHTAHQKGLIHRDIKPSNIMVEMKNGKFRAYITDFGLVREIESSEGGTLAGELLGTPAYMAPEQVRGEMNRIDARTDVYGLGATLYECLVGRVPFPAKSSAEILSKILHEDPASPRNLKPEIPSDLDTIAMKCLEKEPARRYGAAADLAEDLARYLKGDPVLARRSTVAYRLMKRIRKNKFASAMVLVALFIIFGFGIFAWQTRRTAALQARLAQQFGQEAEKIESLLRYSYTLPLHDVRKEKQSILLRLHQIEKQMAELGTVSEGPALYAIGRGHLALQDYERARSILQKAWNADYRTPELSYSLGLTLAQLYKTALREAERITNKELREFRIREIRNQYLEPTRYHLNRAGMVQTESSSYLRSLAAFLNGRKEEAIRHAKQAFAEVPWLYESKRLEGDVYISVASELVSNGKHKEAREQYDRATEAYKTALLIGRSDGALHTADCQRQIEMIWLSQSEGVSIKSLPASALASCDLALRIDPKNGEAFEAKSKIHYMLATENINQGKDGDHDIQKAIEMAQSAIALMADDEAGYKRLGDAYYLAGHVPDKKSRIPLDQAAASYEKVLQINPNNFFARNSLANVYSTRTEHAALDSLENPLPYILRSIQYYEKAIQLNSKYFGTYSNLATSYRMKGSLEMSKGVDGEASFVRSIELNKKALALNPAFPYLFVNIGMGYSETARSQTLKGTDPEQSIQAAVKNLQHAIDIIPQIMTTHVILGKAYYAKALYQLQSGKNPAEAADLSRQSLQTGIRLAPEQGHVRSCLGFTEILNAQYNITTNSGSPDSFLENAMKAFRKAEQLPPRDMRNYLGIAQVYRWNAEWKLRRGINPERDILNGLAAAAKALSIDPEAAEAIGTEAALHFLQSKSQSDPTKREAAKTIARKKIEKAIQMNRLLPQEYHSLRKSLDF